MINSFKKIVNVKFFTVIFIEFGFTLAKIVRPMRFS